jgi:hypothetical protein
MATTTCTSGAGLRKAELLGEIQIRLELTEVESERMRLRFRSLPEGHPERDRLLRQLEIAAAICAELADLEGLISGRKDFPDHPAESPARPECRARE